MRRELDELAGRTGLSVADLTRLGIRKLLADPDLKLPAPTEAQR
jgi:hypothetical protein